MLDINEPIEFDNGERVGCVTKDGSGFTVTMLPGQNAYRNQAGDHTGLNFYYDKYGTFGGGSREAFKYLVNVKVNPADFEFDI